ncbi:uncharacterized protein SCHCODRAFT_01175254 [Schizophyllum commune H4-8]|uniref:Uncharacterized protein n=1 Tax=Schizophyllum commune (strain H4-8 / FGSC 9210) TaxID=578458 RepID=D8QGJ9_SCHCM|nr:uncharacterized protein SCHCODRAFT_01175254 [Schizophyllum commune H4-8]KAI5886732.1 hypothetical protein SCHCODRAFT_01175254 [Schizophyllum commune H4-8]
MLQDLPGVDEPMSTTPDNPLRSQSPSAMDEDVPQTAKPGVSPGPSRQPDPSRQGGQTSAGDPANKGGLGDAANPSGAINPTTETGLPGKGGSALESDLGSASRPVESDSPMAGATSASSANPQSSSSAAPSQAGEGSQVGEVGDGAQPGQTAAAQGQQIKNRIVIELPTYAEIVRQKQAKRSSAPSRAPKVAKSVEKQNKDREETPIEAVTFEQAMENVEEPEDPAAQIDKILKADTEDKASKALIGFGIANIFDDIYKRKPGNRDPPALSLEKMKLLAKAGLFNTMEKETPFIIVAKRASVDTRPSLTFGELITEDLPDEHSSLYKKLGQVYAAVYDDDVLQTMPEVRHSLGNNNKVTPVPDTPEHTLLNLLLFVADELVQARSTVHTDAEAQAARKTALLKVVNAVDVGNYVSHIKDLINTQLHVITAFCELGTIPLIRNSKEARAMVCNPGRLLSFASSGYELLVVIITTWSTELEEARRHGQQNFSPVFFDLASALIRWSDVQEHSLTPAEQFVFGHMVALSEKAAALCLKEYLVQGSHKLSLLSWTGYTATTAKVAADMDRYYDHILAELQPALEHDPQYTVIGIKANQVHDRLSFVRRAVARKENALSPLSWQARVPLFSPSIFGALVSRLPKLDDLILWIYEYILRNYKSLSANAMLSRISASLVKKNMVMPPDLSSIHLCTAGFIEAWTDHIINTQHRHKQDITIDMEVTPAESILADIKTVFALGKEVLRKAKKSHTEYKEGDDLPLEVLDQAKFITSHVLNRSLSDPLNKLGVPSARNGHIGNVSLACTYSVYHLLVAPPQTGKEVAMSARTLFEAHPALVNLHTFIIKCLSSDDVLGGDFQFWHLIWFRKNNTKSQPTHPGEAALPWANSTRQQQVKMVILCVERMPSPMSPMELDEQLAGQPEERQEEQPPTQADDEPPAQLDDDVSKQQEDQPPSQQEDQPPSQPDDQLDTQHDEPRTAQPEQQPEQSTTQEAIKTVQQQVQHAAQLFADPWTWEEGGDVVDEDREAIDNKVYKSLKELWKETNRHMRAVFISKNAPLTCSQWDKETEKYQKQPNWYKVKDVIDAYKAQLQSILDFESGTSWTVESFTKEHKLELQEPTAADFAKVDQALREAAKGVRAGKKRKAPPRKRAKGKGKKAEESTDDEMDVDEDSEEKEEEEEEEEEEEMRDVIRQTKRPRRRAPRKAVMVNDDDERMSPETEDST